MLGGGRRAGEGTLALISADGAPPRQARPQRAWEGPGGPGGEGAGRGRVPPACVRGQPAVPWRCSALAQGLGSHLGAMLGPHWAPVAQTASGPRDRG